MKIPLEDSVADIIGKAQRGLGIDDQALGLKANLKPDQITALKSGQGEPAQFNAVGRALNLSGRALEIAARKQWYPQDPGPVDGLACFNTPYEDMTVNSYLVWDPDTLNGVAFDTGADAAGMTALAAEKRIRIQLVLLTHTHPDHIADLPRLAGVTEAGVFVSKQEAIEGAETFEAGRKFTVGKLQIQTRLTSGHSRGGITYFITGLSRPVAIVGDAIFAGSMGGGGVSYSDAIRNNREQILTLPENTILCPGHGPLTTVAEEKLHNPFYA